MKYEIQEWGCEINGEREYLGHHFYTTSQIASVLARGGAVEEVHGFGWIDSAKQFERLLEKLERN